MLLNLGMLTGLSIGWVVAGALAVGLPVAAHLLSRRGGRTAIFPAMRFVLLASADHARRHRLRDALLFSLRALALVLIALAFDQPVWLASGSPATSGAGRNIVLVLDASASMTRTEAGRTLFDDARDRAISLLSELDPATDRAGVVVARLQPESLLPRMSHNITALIERLRSLEPTLEHADMTGAIALADGLRGTSGAASIGAARTIVVIGDRQRSQWQATEPPPGASVVFEPVGPAGASSNLGVTRIAVSPQRPLVGEETVVAATVSNFGERPRSPLVVLRSRGHEFGSAASTVSPDSSATLSFVFTPIEPGLHPIEAALIDESFLIDDIRRAVVHVRPARRVTLVTLTEPSLASASYFVEAALSPSSSARHDVARLRPDSIDARIESTDLIVLVEAGAIDDRARDALATAVRRGTPLVWVVDSEPAARSFARFAEDATGGAISATGEFLSVADAANAVVGARFDRPPLASLAGPLEEALLSTRVSTIAPSSLRPPSIALAGTVQGPLITQTPIGTGSMLAIHAAIDPARCTLVRSPVFPILLNEIASVLSASGGRVESPSVGEPVGVRVLSGAVPPLSVDGRVVFDQPSAVESELVLPLDSRGAPEFVEVTDARGALVGAASVNIDPVESDTRSLGDDDIRAILAPDDVSTSSNSAEGLVGRRSVELWPWLLALASVVVTFEWFVVAGRAKNSERAWHAGAHA